MSIAETIQIIGPESAGTLMTPEEFDTAENWDEFYVYELINGVLIVNPPPSEGERGPNELLGNLLYVYKTQHPQGSALNYTLHEHTITTHLNRRRADRVIWAGLSRMPNVRRDSPTITVEWVSAGLRNRQRDYQAKRAEYTEIGVSEYWIIDRFQRKMTVVRRRDDGQLDELVFGENDIYTTPRLPGFALPLARLFAEADQLERPRREGQ